MFEPAPVNSSVTAVVPGIFPPKNKLEALPVPVTLPPADLT